MNRMRPAPIAVSAAIERLTFLADRTPTIDSDRTADAFKQLSVYRDGGIFVGHWAGDSEWERHTAGDEIVMVIEGTTTIFFMDDEFEHSATLRAGVNGHLDVLAGGRRRSSLVAI